MNWNECLLLLLFLRVLCHARNTERMCSVKKAALPGKHSKRPRAAMVATLSIFVTISACITGIGATYQYSIHTGYDLQHVYLVLVPCTEISVDPLIK